MQSILQYRRFHQHNQEQIRRHGLHRVTSCATEHERPGPTTNQRGRLDGPTRDLPRSRDVHSSAERVDGQNSNPISTLSGDDVERNDVERKELDDPEKLFPLPHTAQHLHANDHLERKHEHTPFDDSATGGQPENDQFSDKNDLEDLAGSTPRESISGSDTSSEASSPTLEEIPTQQTNGTALGQRMTGVDVRPRKSNEGSDGRSKVFVVGYQGEDDPMNPHNWSRTKRMGVTMIIVFVGLIVGFASSIDSAAIQQARISFGVSEVAESMATGIYLIGFGFGAFFAAPVSETIGRNPVYIVTMLMFMIFIMASALAPNIGAQLVFRLLAGLFGATPLVVAGGSLSDMWSPLERTAVFPVFANSAFWGPVLGPVIGGFIGQSSVLSWRWCEWITLIWAALIFTAILFIMPETYAPVLLQWKAASLRKIIGDDRYVSPLEVRKESLFQRIIHNLYRPFVMFAYEPIVVLFTLYLSVVNIVLFTFLTGFEFIFTETYGLPQGLTFLIFVALGIGFVLASTMVPSVYRSYRRALKKAQADNAGAKLPPERRLIFAMICAPFLPIGLFWMGWTAYPSISFWSPICACLPVGFAIMGIFISTYQYLIDAYEMYAASALVGATFVRYIAAGGMIPVSIPFYKNLGVHWTLTILGCISAIMVPVPYVFWRYGAAIRKKSRHAAAF